MEGSLSVPQTMLSKEESPLLDTAISKLYPRVFSHPVWVRFGMKEEVSPETIKALFIEVEDLKLSNPGDACQILSICAVFQHYSGQTKNALTTLHMAQETAKRTGCEW